MHAALFSLLLFVFAPQQDPTVDAIIKEGKDRSQVMEHLDGLANKIGPRLTSSDNLTKAQEWARDRFKDYGLDARLEEWGTFPVGFNRGPWSGKIAKPVEMKLECGTMAWTAGTDGPVRGKAIFLPKDQAEFDEVKDNVKGAWVVISKRSRDRKMQQLCEEAGAAGLVVSSGGELIETMGGQNIKWEKLPTRVTVYVIASQFKLIEGLVEGVKGVELEFDIKNEFKQGPIKLYDVVADLKGSEKPDEYVVVGGHCDSWDGARGALDNGTGCATTIEAARILAKAGAKPKRTIRFMLYSGEEQGLLGSGAFVKAHKDEMAKYSVCLVHDGGTNYLSGICATEKQAPIFEKVFAPIRDLDASMPFKIHTPFSIIPFSDHFSFFTAGVPSFFWDQAGHSDYNFAHHTQNDLFKQAIKEYQIHSSIVIAVAAYNIANLDELLPREGMSRSSTAGHGARGRRLGLMYGDGMKITDVTEGSPAAKAGVRVDDVLMKIGDVEVKDHDSLIEGLQKAGKETTLTVQRDGKAIDLKITFEAAEAPEEPRRRLGIQLGEGMAVASLSEDMPGAKSGLKEGDVLLTMDGKELTNREDLMKVMNDGKKEKKLVVERDGKKVELNVTFEE